MKKIALILMAGYWAGLVPAPLSGQTGTAAELEALLETPAVTYDQAARFVLGAAGEDRSGGAEDAFRRAAAQGYLPQTASSGGFIRLGELSFLMMRAFGLRGGVMYAIAPGPRYAYRSLVSRSLIQGGTDPAMTVSGYRFHQILGKVLSYTGTE
ncbi:MAG: hypothetical protein LBD37_07080 [Treponema sp.]|nr:hypothetical protein [Treponema sp.]